MLNFNKTVDSGLKVWYINGGSGFNLATHLIKMEDIM